MQEYHSCKDMLCGQRARAVSIGPYTLDSCKLFSMLCVWLEAVCLGPVYNTKLLFVRHQMPSSS